MVHRKPAFYAVAIVLLLIVTSPSTAYDGPRLDGLPGEDLFRDGSAVVRLAHTTDGDTAAFIIDGTVYPTRFLAVNTPETSHPTDGAEPWGQAAKDFTGKMLENAGEIILQTDPESDLFDHYDRLLAWVWVDGELLNYRLVEEGLAWVMYLYGDYMYNTIMIQKEAEVRKTKIRIHGQQDPDYDYEKILRVHTLETVRDEKQGTRVQVEGTVTAKIGNNVFIQDRGSGIYCYASGYRWRHFETGKRIRITGMLGEYNNLLEIVNIEEVELVSEDHPLPLPAVINPGDIDEEYEGSLVSLKGIRIDEVTGDGNKGYNVMVSKNGETGIIRIDAHLKPYIEPAFFVPGRRADITAPVGQYRNSYQLMLARVEDFTYTE